MSHDHHNHVTVSVTINGEERSATAEARTLLVHYIRDHLGLTGVVVTKLDGSGKGGCVISIQKELGISTEYVGSGEAIDTLAAFQPKRFVEELL